MSGKRFQRGLVIGKFSPLHRGHELVIQRALETCEDVVLISYSAPQFPCCDANRREQWLAALFPTTKRLVVTDEWLARNSSHPRWRTVPRNDDDETTHRRFCAFLCREMLHVTVDAVFTSESYGDGFAAELTRDFQKHNPSAKAVTHVLVDQARALAPISGTLLRANVHAHREWLSPEVYRSFVQRVCILGGESSGKTSLAEQLARALETKWVPEYGRELWEARHGRLEFDDMLHIAREQVAREEKEAGHAHQFLICDTSPLTTFFYSEYLFGRADDELRTFADRGYDYTLLCAPDFEFVQDGTRQPAEFRMKQHDWYLQQLAARKTPFHLVCGTMEQRLQSVGKLLRC